MCNENNGNPPFNVSIEPVELEISQLRVTEAPRKLNVVNCDQSTGCIEVKFGGGYSGDYEWVVESTNTSVGNIDTSEHPLKILVEVTDVQPGQSSRLGGAELTLTGGVFSTDIAENIVKVGD